MVTVKEIYDYIDSIAPYEAQESYDNSGLNIGSFNAPVAGIYTALDCTKKVLIEAEKAGANLVVCHHPVIFHGLKRLSSNSVVYSAARKNIAVLSAHTNLDKACGARLLLEKLKRNLPFSDIRFRGDYAAYCDCEAEFIGEFTGEDLARAVSETFGCTLDSRSVYDSELITRVAAAPGACDSPDMIYAACDGETRGYAYITGEARWDKTIDAQNDGITLLTVGHRESELPMVSFLKTQLAEKFPGVNITCEV